MDFKVLPLLLTGKLWKFCLLSTYYTVLSGGECTLYSNKQRRDFNGKTALTVC